MKYSILTLALIVGVIVAVSEPLAQATSSQNGTAVIAQKTKGGGTAVLLPKDISTKQQQNLLKAYEIAKKDGHKDPELLQAVVFQETKAGGMEKYRVAGQEFGLKPGERYYGVAQIKLTAAKDVLKNFPELKKKYLQTDTDEELMASLMLNDEFNMSIASKYLLMMTRYGNSSAEFKAAAYNKGPGGVQNVDPKSLKYVQNVKSFMSQFKADRAKVPHEK